MSLRIDPTKILEYFDNVVDPIKANQLYSFYIARSICHVGVQIDGHNLNYHCHCFMCRICQILLTMLLSKKHQRLLEIVKISNYLYVTDEMIISNI